MILIKNKFIIVTILAVSLLSFTSEKPKILIIGDSISLGYTPFVKEELTDKAFVIHNRGNAQHTGTGIKKIIEWIGEEEWDIIQFNWGLWDLCYRHPDSKVQGNRDKENGKITYDIDGYASNLDSIVTLMQTKTDAKFIFVTTSYVPENEAGRFQNDAIRYNEAAKKIMDRHSVNILDIYSKSKSIHKKYGKGSDDVHYTEKGYEKLGELIGRNLLKELKSIQK